MKEWIVIVKKGEKATVLGQLNKMQTTETIKEYMKTDYEITIIPINKTQKNFTKTTKTVPLPQEFWVPTKGDDKK
ncbi:MAG: hypothetical protein IKI95_07405 [Clostridia bacterium]|nr:hypothetical protein [Clostridia bacterium]